MLSLLYALAWAHCCNENYASQIPISALTQCCRYSNLLGAEWGAPVYSGKREFPACRYGCVGPRAPLNGRHARKPVTKTSTAALLV